ncbi:MAG: hypothetical protein K2Q18_16275 [Bdellovibrionales bacterium]|nr:hypothetical protein [Bdellovibrionales bacterium]
MKTLIAFALLTMASLSFGAETCTYVIKDRYAREFESHTRTSYNEAAACSDAEYACRVSLSNHQSSGRYYDANCERKFDRYPPNPYPYPSSRCTTDLLDVRSNILRSFQGIGRSQLEACQDSERQCKMELVRNDSYGRHCATRSGGKPPQPPRQTTESCTVGRYDPAGYFIQSYFASHTGSFGTDVKGEACRKANQSCSYELRGRQTCRIQR